MTTWRHAKWCPASNWWPRLVLQLLHLKNEKAKTDAKKDSKDGSNVRRFCRRPRKERKRLAWILPWIPSKFAPTPRRESSVWMQCFRWKPRKQSGPRSHSRQRMERCKRQSRSSKVKVEEKKKSRKRKTLTALRCLAKEVYMNICRRHFPNSSSKVLLRWANLAWHLQHVHQSSRHCNMPRKCLRLLRLKKRRKARKRQQQRMRRRKQKRNMKVSRKQVSRIWRMDMKKQWVKKWRRRRRRPAGWKRNWSKAGSGWGSIDYWSWGARAEWYWPWGSGWQCSSPCCSHPKGCCKLPKQVAEQ